MAEKITIFEIDIDVEASKNDIEELRLAVNDLKDGLKELTQAEKENNKQLDEQRKKLKDLQTAKKQDVKAIAETQKNIDKLLTKRTELNKKIIDQSTALKVNQTDLRNNQKVIENSISINDRYNKELEEERIKQQLLTAERKKAIREGIKLGNETRELVALQKKEQLSEAELIRLQSLLVKRRKNLIVSNKETRKEYNKLTVSIAAANKQLIKNDKSIGRFQRNVGNYTNALKGLGGALGITGGIAGIAQLVNSSTEAYKEQAVVVTQLSTVLRERTNATDAQIESILDLTDAQQELGIIGDEIQIAGAQQLATFVTQTDTIETLIPALNNLLAQQKGVNASQSDAVSIANLFGKSLQGEVTALKRVGVSFSDAQKEILKYGNEEERAATLAQVITDNVGEMNAEIAKTDIGQLKNLENQLGDVKEEIGKETLPVFVKLNQLLLKLTKSLTLMRKDLENLLIPFRQLNKEIVEQNTKSFITTNEFLTETEKVLNLKEQGILLKEKTLALQKEIADNTKTFLGIKLFSRERVEQNKLLNQYKEELRLLGEVAKNKEFFTGQKIKSTQEETKTEQQLEEERKKAEAARKKREKARQEIERKKEEDAKKEKERLEELTRLEEERRKKAIEDAFEEFERVRDLEKQKSEFLKNAREELIEQEKERQIVDQENELALLEGSILGELEAERRGLELKRQQEIEFAEKIGADTTLIEAKYAKAREELNEAETSAKLSLAEDFFNNVATIAGKGTAVGKAAAVAATTISTYQAATGSFAALSGIPVVGPILGAVAAAAAVAAGIANVRKILAVKTGLPGDTGAGGGTTPTASSAPTISTPRPGAIAPEVGQGIIARGIPFNNNQQAAPQTAVVVDEVTAKQTQQESNSNTSVI
jgi:hypothetical protein